MQYPILSQVMSLIIIGLFLKNFFEARANYRNTNIEEIPIFNIYEHRPVGRKNRDKKKENSIKSYIEPVVDQNFKQECMDCLKSLGVRRQKERKDIVENIFQESNPQTTRDFILAYCKNKT